MFAEEEQLKNHRMFFQSAILTAMLACAVAFPQNANGMFEGRLTIPGCVLEAVPNSNNMAYRVMGPSGFQFEIPCPKNTKFDKTLCACNWVKDPENPPGGDQKPSTPSPVEGGTTAESTTTTQLPCQKRPHMTERNLYEEYVRGFDWMVRECAVGTLFNETGCGCYDFDPNQSYECRPQLWINFNGLKIEDSAGQHMPIGNNGNVANVSSAGRFDGTGTLTVWQYANMDFGEELTINLRFYEYGGGISDEQVIASNCFGNQLGSVEIAINQRSKVVIFRGDARHSPPVEISIPYPEKSWKNVTLIYNGQMLIGKVNEEIQTAQLKGPLALRFNGLLIGSCKGRGFVGYIDDFRLFRCLQEGPLKDMGLRPNMNMNNDLMGMPAAAMAGGMMP